MPSWGNAGPLLRDAGEAAASDHDIADTAFWVNVDRARRVDISRDVYARLWVTQKSEELWEEMARTVYPYSDISVSLRNRYYLSLMERFAAEEAEASIINIAAGFTMYPYLLPEACRSLEVDYPKVVAFKAKKIAAWTAQGTLPARDVAYFGFDLSTDVRDHSLDAAMRDWLGSRKGFALMEGLTYYLPKQSLDRLFAALAETLPAGSLVAFEHWPSDADAYPSFVRFKRHMEERFGWKPHGFTLFDDDYVRALPGFRLIEAVDLPEVERRFCGERVMQARENRLPHLFKVLQREES